MLRKIILITTLSTLNMSFDLYAGTAGSGKYCMDACVKASTSCEEKCQSSCTTKPCSPTSCVSSCQSNLLKCQDKCTEVFGTPSSGGGSGGNSPCNCHGGHECKDVLGMVGCCDSIGIWAACGDVSKQKSAPQK